VLTEDDTLVPKHVADRKRAANVWAITQRVVVISYRRFGRTYRYHLPQGV